MTNPNATQRTGLGKLAMSLTLLAVTVSLNGCAATSSGDAACNSASSSLVDAVMAKAKSNFQFVAGNPDSAFVENIRAVSARTVELPAELRKYGFTHVIGIWIHETDRNPSGEPGGSTEGAVYLVTDDTGRQVMPLEGNSEGLFGWTPASGADQKRWAQAVYGSTSVDRVGRCMPH